MVKIITYEALYEILRKEKYSIDIQPLPKTFFKDVINYLKEKELILKNQEKESSFHIEIEKTRKQIENTKKLLKELYEKREKKLMDQALLSSKTDIRIQEDNLLQEEIQFHKELKDLLTNYREGILHRILSKKQPELTKEEPKEIKTTDNNNSKLVRFLTEIPKFIGTDLNIYGPFEREDLANLPKDIAKVLIEKKRAEEIKSEI